MSGATAMAGPVGTVRWEAASSGVVHLVLDTSATAGAVDAALMLAFEGVAARVAEQATAIPGVVIRSDTPGWFCRTDIDPVASLDAAGATELAARYARFAAALRRIETSVPTVALIHGSALGVGLEIALACHHRICTDSAQLRLGLPDIGVGLLPPVGGMARAARLFGFADAFNKVLVSGVTMDPTAALQLGLVDALVPESADLLPAAERWLAEHADARQPWDRKGWQMPGGAPSSPTRYFTLHAMPALLRKEFECPHHPAPLQLLSAVVDGAIAGDFQATLKVEHRHVLQVLRQPATARLVQALHVDRLRLAGHADIPLDAQALRAQLRRPWALDPEGGAACGPGALAFAGRIARSLADVAQAMLTEGIARPSLAQASRQAGFAVSVLEMIAHLGLSQPALAGSAQLPAIDTSTVSLDALQSRLLEAGAREAVACIQAGLLPEPAQGDIVSILGAGYPAWTGGALRHARHLGLF